MIRFSAIHMAGGSRAAESLPMTAVKASLRSPSGEDRRRTTPLGERYIAPGRPAERSTRSGQADRTSNLSVVSDHVRCRLHPPPRHLPVSPLDRSHRCGLGEEKGYWVSERGRVAPEIIDAFFAAHPEILEQAGRFEMVHATARTPGPSRRVRVGERGSRLGDIYTIVFVRRLDEHEMLRRMGAANEDIRLIADGDHSIRKGRRSSP